jgi:O-antigen ligase
MVIYYARPEDWVPGLSHAPLAKIAGIFAVLGLVLSLRDIRWRLPKEIIFLSLLTGQLFVASFMTPVWRGGALQETLNFAKILIIVFTITAAVTTYQRLRLLILTQAVSVSAIAAVAIWKGHLILGRLLGILGGNYSDPNDLALAIVMSLPLCLALLFLGRNRLPKILWAITMLVMIYAIFLTGSRGGFLSLIVTGAVGLWDFAIRGRRRYLLVIATLLGVIVLLLWGGMLVGRLEGTFNAKEDTGAAYASAKIRQEVFWRSVEVTKEHPLFGVGPGNFMQVSNSWHVAHNSFTQISSEGGVPALIFYVLILWSGFVNIRATRRFAQGQRQGILLAKGLHASLAGYVVGSCFLSVPYAFFPYILVAYTTALSLISKKSEAQAKKVGATPVVPEAAPLAYATRSVWE